MSGTITWVKCHKLISVLTAMALILTGCIAGMMIHDARSQGPFWIIYGGNTDKGDGQGGGGARDQLVAGGWTSYENSFQITWNADIGAGTANQTDAAMPAGHDAVNNKCRNGCVIAGFSLGASPAIQLSDETGTPAENTFLFGAPQPSTGVWHSQFQDNPIVEPWVQQIGGLKSDRAVRAGMQNFFDIRDPYNNAAPQCQGPGLFALTLDGHRIISKGEAEGSHIWTGVDGVRMHEVGYGGPLALPASGADESQPWAGCHPDGWHGWKSTVNSPDEGTGGSSTDLGPAPDQIPTGPPGIPHPEIPGLPHP